MSTTRTSVIVGLQPDFLEVSLEEFDIRLVHGKTALFTELGKTRVIEFGEALDNLYRLGFGHLHLERFACLERSFARFNWVDNVMLDGGNIRLGKFALQHVHFGAANCRAFTLADELNAFARRISALVKLTGKELDGKNRLAAGLSPFRAASTSGQLSHDVSTWGSLNTTGMHCLNSSSEMPSTS